MVSHDAGNFEVASDLKYLVQNVVHGLLNAPVGDNVNVIENDHGFLEFGDLDWVLVDALIELDPLGLDLIDGLVVRQTREQIDRVILMLLLVLFQELPGVG